MHNLVCVVWAVVFGAEKLRSLLRHPHREVGHDAEIVGTSPQSEVEIRFRLIGDIDHGAVGEDEL